MKLSPAELRVAEQVATGASNPQIATTLHLSVNTVKSHVVAIHRKLGVHSRVEMALWFRRRDALGPIRALADAAPRRRECRLLVDGQRRVVVYVAELRRALDEAERAS